MSCPICDKASQAPFKPFCSKRCTEVDLGKWLKGDYAVPVVESDDEPSDMEDIGEVD